MKLQPTLWRTCRVVACETRLRLLWLLFENGELCVGELARRAGMSEPNASNQLRALNARGLIQPRRERMRVLYRAEANSGIDFAPRLLEALWKCHKLSMPLEGVVWQATAFTHGRRIGIVRALNGGKPLSLDALRDATGMSLPALLRHLKKLEARGFARRRGRVCRLARPRNPLGRTLLKIAVS